MDAFRMDDYTHTPMSQDAALVAALAGTAMPFAHSAEDQAERWLRAIRLHGRVGMAMQSLGVGEAPLMTGSEPVGEEPAGTPLPEGDVVARIVSRSGDLARERGAETVGTTDLLFALFEEYGKLMDRALYLRGASREELVERLAETAEASVNRGG
jgi:hypothetical protein